MVEYRINVGDRIKIPGICNNLVSVLGFIVRINALTLGKKLNNRLKMDRTIDGCNCKNDGSDINELINSGENTNTNKILVFFGRLTALIIGLFLTPFIMIVMFFILSYNILFKGEYSIDISKLVLAIRDKFRKDEEDIDFDSVNEDDLELITPIEKIV